MLKYTPFFITILFLFSSFRFADIDSMSLNSQAECLLQPESFTGQSPVIPQNATKELLDPSVKKLTNDTKKKRYRVAKYLRHKNLFFTSKCFMLFHIVQNILYWMTAIIFPLIAVIGC